jgi:SynChlorMet cassette radical SAM/SPASM protein ScmE
MKKKSRNNADTLSDRVMRTPRSVDVEITSRCNLRCRYCYFFDNSAATYKDLSTEKWLQFFDELGHCGVMDVCLAGGEPFIREDILLLIDGIVKNRMRYSILSNGTLINNDIAELIADTKRCDFVQVSIDGSCAEVHESGRGKGSFDMAVQSIKTLQKHDIPVTVRVTIHRQNIKDLENTAQFLLEELGVPGFSTNSAGYFGSCQKNADDLLLRVKDRQIAMAILLKLEQKYIGRVTAQAGPLADAHHWTRMESARKNNAPQFDNGGTLTGCGCPTNKIAVRADGVIVPCFFLNHMELGMINQDTFEDVWQKNHELQNLRKRHHMSLKNFEECVDCEYTPYCTGNCPGSAFTLTGKVNQPSPDACLQRFLAAGGIIPVVGQAPNT